MANVKEKAQCFVWVAENKSVTVVQCKYRRQYRKEPRPKPTFWEWFLETGRLLQCLEDGLPSIGDERVEFVRESFHYSPQKSLRLASLELNMPTGTIDRTIHKRLQVYVFKLWLVQTRSEMTDYIHLVSASSIKPTSCAVTILFCDVTLLNLETHETKSLSV